MKKRTLGFLAAGRAAGGDWEKAGAGREAARAVPARELKKLRREKSGMGGSSNEE
jgi:hypothetical protein